MFGSFFDVLIVKPIFNLLVFIYTIIPGHNFGLSIIIFTLVIRLLMWPLVKKQLRQARAMRELQPEIKRIKQATKGNRQQESVMLMELYKEKEISPFGSIGTLAVQFVILIGLYSGLRRVVASPSAIINFSYSWMHHFSWIKQLSANIHLFDSSLLGFVNLTRAAVSPKGSIYLPAMIIVLASAITQYYSSKQLLPTNKDSKGLRKILKDANQGKSADQSEISSAVGQSTRYLIPVFIFIFTVYLASALSLYWFVGGLVAYLQQGYLLRKDERAMEANPPSDSGRPVIKSEVISQTKPNKKTRSSKSKKRRKK